MAFIYAAPRKPSLHMNVASRCTSKQHDGMHIRNNIKCIFIYSGSLLRNKCISRTNENIFYSETNMWLKPNEWLQNLHN